MKLWIPVLGSIAFSTFGYADGNPKVETPQATVELVSQYEAAAPGTTQWIGIYFKPKAGWHVYWKNPGDSGLPPRVEFSSLPNGSKFGPLEFGTPDRIPYGPLVNFGYEGDVLYPASWSAPANLSVGESVSVTANVKWLICAKECVPGKATLTLSLPVRDAVGLASTPGTHTPKFAETLASMAKPSEGKIRVAVSPESIEIQLGSSKAKNLSKARLAQVFFFPGGDYGVASSAQQSVSLVSDGLKIRVPRKENKPLGEVRGVLKISENEAYEVAEVINPKLVAPIAATVTPPPSSGDENPLLLMLFFAFVGGLILNLMPCILPVLSIKVLSLANQAGENRKQVRNHGIVFTLGVLVSFWALAAILLSVRASGQTLGWGFQLQNPVFVAILALLFFFMALNLFGVFEVSGKWMGTGSSLANGEGYRGTFFTGVLTTVAATPCSAPFMGSALGFALTQSASVALLVLTVLALGLAFPYLLFSFLPGASKILPRPGHWMKTLKEVLAFPLLATVVWLVGVIGAQTGAKGTQTVLVLLVLGGVLAWLWGKTTLRSGPTLAKRVLIGLSVLFLFSTLQSIGRIESRTEKGTSALLQAPWKEWTPEAEASARREGKTVLVNFTASWCVTCKVNEVVVFENERIKKALASPSVVGLLADWTNGDAAITEALTRVGRNSVPVYLLYRPGSTNAEILPQILSVDGLLKDLGKN